MGKAKFVGVELHNKILDFYRRGVKQVKISKRLVLRPIYTLFRNNSEIYK